MARSPKHPAAPRGAAGARRPGAKKPAPPGAAGVRRPAAAAASGASAGAHFVPKHRQFSKLGAIIERVFSDLQLKQKARGYKVVSSFAAVLGEPLASYVLPTIVRKGVLYVNVPNSAWAGELVFRKDEIIRRLNGFMHTKVIHDLRVRVNAEAFLEREAAPAAQPEFFAPPPVDLATTYPDIARTLAAISDENLRDHAAAAIARGLAWVQLREQKKI